MLTAKVGHEALRFRLAFGKDKPLDGVQPISPGGYHRVILTPP
jgi:hypothetical protein